MNLSTIFKPAQFTSEVCVGLKYFAETLKHGRCNLSPAYQRGSVWSQEQRENFMGFYVRLNSAGTPHTREQLLAAMAA